MLKNNNQTAIKRLSRRSLKQNCTRNLFAILAIILTTFMFTSVFGIGFSLAQNMMAMRIRTQGTKTTITLKQPSEEQLEEVKEHIQKRLGLWFKKMGCYVFLQKLGSRKL